MNRILPIAAMGIVAASLIARGQGAPAPPQSAETIMAKVAANQDLAVAERGHYVYVQHAKMASRKGGTLMCEEVTDDRVTPTAEGSHDELLKVDGRMRDKHRYVSYTALLPETDSQAKDAARSTEAGSVPNSNVIQEKGERLSGTSEAKAAVGRGQANDDEAISVEIGDGNTDRQLVEHMRKNLINDKSRDGINARLFPLTSKAQEAYIFQFAGRERLNGRDVFHVIFRPRDRQDFSWKGDAYIDTAAFEPVLVTTGMSRKVPFAVRTFLGTNLPGLGFTVTYAPQPDGVWFPVTFSTEFKIEVLFFFRRTITMDAKNVDFEKTHVTSRIVGEAAPVEPDKP